MPRLAVLRAVAVCCFCLSTLFVPLSSSAESVNGQTVETLEWDNLMPADFSPDKIFAMTEQFGSLDDFDPRAQQALDEMMISLKSAPARPELDGKMVKLPGFVVPLEGIGDQVSSFFLVPYFGACIHVPPPPANQMVHVRYEPGVRVENLYDAIWVTGKLSVAQSEHELGTAGYTMDAFRIEVYEEDYEE
ncbi:MAG: DUF3299 domain-containing protein [Marinobacterium sp.]|nr:DUF3299 domain-containing protein [Marinobacterium sp.]